MGHGGMESSANMEFVGASGSNMDGNEGERDGHTLTASGERVVLCKLTVLSTPQYSFP